MERAAPARGLPVQISAFLSFCRVEKGLAANSLDAYRRDLERFGQWTTLHGISLTAAGREELRQYIDTLYSAGLKGRSVARHITAIRSLYKYLIEQHVVEADPTEFLVQAQTRLVSSEVPQSAGCRRRRRRQRGLSRRGQRR